MTIYRLLPDGTRRTLPSGDVRTLGAPGESSTPITIVAITALAFGLSGSPTAVATATPDALGTVFALTASPSSSSGIEPLDTVFDLSAVPAATAQADVDPLTLDWSLAATPTATRTASVDPLTLTWGLSAAPTGATAIAVTSGPMPMDWTLAASLSVDAILTPAPLTTNWTLTAVASVNTGAGWRNRWLDVYTKRQIVLNAIDANNRFLAQQAGIDAQAAADAVILTNTNVSLLDDRLTAEADRITMLTATVTGNQTATQTALDSLNITVTQQGDDITALGTAVTLLDAELDDKANASALNALQTTVSQQGASITAQATSIGNLTATVGDQSAQITQIAEVAVTNAKNPVRNPSFEEATGWGNAVGSNVLPSGAAYAAGGSARSGVYVMAMSSTATVWNASVVPAVGGQTFRFGLYLRAGGIQPNTGSVLGCTVRFRNASGSQVGSEVFVNFTKTATSIPSNYSTMLVNTATAPVGATNMVIRFATAGLSSGQYLVDDVFIENVDATAAASVGLYLDVNGRVSGWQSLNNGVVTEFNVLADAFRVLGAGAEGMEWQNGYLRVYGSGYQRILGYNFGAAGHNLVDYFGPNVGAAAASKTNATMWMDKGGNAYWGGSLSAGTLKNGMRSTSISTVGLEITNGPFSTNGNVRTVTISYARSHVRTGNTMSGPSGYSAGAGTNTARIRVYRQIGTAAETLWQTLNVPGDVFIVNEADGPDVAVLSWNGSMTVSDTSSAAQTVTYRAIMDQFTQQTVTYSGTSEQQAKITSDLTIISVEQ